MTDDEARKIATQTIDTWPTGPKAYVWINELTPLDAGIARAAFKELRTTHERISTAAFHQCYRTKAREHANDIEQQPPCSVCDGMGWVPAPDFTHPDGRVTSQAAPCAACNRKATA